MHRRSFLKCPAFLVALFAPAVVASVPRKPRRGRISGDPSDPDYDPVNMWNVTVDGQPVPHAVMADKWLQLVVYAPLPLTVNLATNEIVYAEKRGIVDWTFAGKRPKPLNS